MSPIFSYLLNLCLLRAGPQDAPSSDTLLVASGFLVALSYTFTNTIYEGLSLRIIVAVSQVIVFGLVVWLVLKIKNLEIRWKQTLTALYGAAAVFQFATWPVIVFYDDGIPHPTGLPEPLMLHVVVGFWYLAVMANILRHSLETTLVRGVAAGLFCQFSTVLGLLLILWILGIEAAPV